MEKKQAIWTKDFILLCIVSLLMSVAFYFIIPVLPVFISETLHTDHSEIGIILSIYTVSALIIRPFTGWAIDRYGRKWIFIISFIFFSSMFSFYAFATTFMFFFMVRLMHGFTWGVSSTASSTIVVDLLPFKRRGEGLGYYGLAMTIAMALGPFIAVSIMGKSHNYQNLFFSSSALGLLGAVLATFIRYPKIPISDEYKKFKWANMIEPKSIIPSVNTGILLISYGGIISFITLYGKEIGIEKPGIFFLPFALGILVARISSGRVFDLKGPFFIVPIGTFFLIAGFPILAFFKNEIGYLIAALVIGTGIGVIFPTSQAIVNNLTTKNRRGAANSTLFTTVDLGIGFGMFFIGYISDQINFDNAFLLCAAISFIGLLYFYFITYPYYKKYKIEAE